LCVFVVQLENPTIIERQKRVNKMLPRLFKAVAGAWLIAIM
jgi:hypothetical protein